MRRNFLFGLSVALVAAATILIQAAIAADPNPSSAGSPPRHHIQTVFIILMENHNWTGDGNLDIKGNANAPYINTRLSPWRRTPSSFTIRRTTIRACRTICGWKRERILAS